jgi:hypothetical protein
VTSLYRYYDNYKGDRLLWKNNLIN